MAKNKKISNIIKYVKAENSGKGQIQVRYACDEDIEENWFDRYVCDMSMSDLSDESDHIKLRIVPFKENIPNLTEHEWHLVSDALRWIKAHNLERTVTSSVPCSFDDVITKISKRHLSHKGQTTDLLKVLEGMEKGIKYEHLSGMNNTWVPLEEDGYNLYHMINDASTGRIMEKHNGDSK